jgi:hypothetical protein
MIATQRLSQKKNLLLCFDAFGTLFQPTKPIGTQYRKVARRHGIYCPVDQSRDTTVMDAFNRAFKEQSILYPNYGKAIDMEIREWWAGVCYLSKQNKASCRKLKQEIGHCEHICAILR